MLDICEKIIHGFCVLTVLTVATLYLWKGTRDTDPPELLPESIALDVPHRPSSSVAAGTDGESPSPVATPVRDVQAESRRILQELRKNNPRAAAARLETKYMQVQPRTFEYARRDVNWLPQLKDVGRKDLATKDGFTRVQITKMPPNSLLRKIAGLEPNDIIELIDGERLEIDDESSARYADKATELFAKLENGGEATLTITRGGNPLHLVFKLP